MRTNRWDSAALQRFQDSPVVAGRRGAIDAGATVEELEPVVAAYRVRRREAR